MHAERSVPSPRLGSVMALLVMLLAFLPAPAMAQEVMTARQLMEATGLHRVFETYGRDIALSVHQQPIPAGDPFIRAWEDAAAEVYDADDMHDALEDALTGVFSAQEQTALRDFYLSDLGREIVRLEDAAMGLEPEQQRLIEQEGAELWDGLSSERQAMMLRIQELAGGDMVPVMLRETMRSLYLGMSLADPNRPGALDSSTINALVDQIMPSLLDEVNAATRSLSAVIYEDLADDDLAIYLTFLETGEARKFYHAVLIGMTGVTVEATEAFGRDLVRKMTRQAA